MELIEPTLIHKQTIEQQNNKYKKKKHTISPCKGIKLYIHEYQ